MQGGVFGALGDAASVSKFLDTFPPKPVDVSAAGGGGGKPGFASASAAELKTVIKDQEAEIARQQKLIEDLQAQLKGKG